MTGPRFAPAWVRADITRAGDRVVNIGDQVTARNRFNQFVKLRVRVCGDKWVTGADRRGNLRTVRTADITRVVASS